MASLHITKVAVGCASTGILAQRIAARASDGWAPVFTRFRPKRADELIGGSLYWIIKHRLAARQTILGFDTAEEGKRCIIRLDARLVPVRAYPRPAHQGWRYLAEADAPPDLDAGGGDLGDLPDALASELAALLLI
ncbi:MAG TPA: DUF1489 domain-containing protein [Sphingomonadaceae bacterium]|nr:DUF1489 domain-containing protein [Sphingomonadaceae bacterium]